ncbi:MAG: Unknown protein [uncultured Campylobacterales bacterium]|uniref:VWFA domain-containing protein n=1 Tax=uncultured Campylobacterales bacterium TaxID=352960 RepID=A0A6S6S9V9_9BACT|nr:MAG: Unknown protein [uncultured Campylobacterales bacterium]
MDNFAFLNPYFLFAIFGIVLVLFRSKSTQNLSKYFSKQVLSKIYMGSDSKINKNIFLFLSLLFIMLALARPVINNGETKISSELTPLVVGFDLSKSMNVDDLYPSRIESAKNKFLKLLQDKINFKIALIGFASESFLISPLSEDSDAIKYFVENLSSEYISLGGTDILNALIHTNKLIKSNNKNLLLYTDGGEKTDFSKEIKYAKKNGIKVYVYMTASLKGGVIKENKKIIKDRQNNIVISRKNENIKELAIQTGGKYFEYKISNDARELLSSIKTESKSKYIKTIKNNKELFYYPLILSIIFLFLYMFTFRKSLNVSYIFVLFLILPKNLDAGILDFWQENRANNSYQAKDFNKSLEYFNKIEKKSGELEFNKASLYYQKQDFDKAINIYEDINFTSDEKNSLKYFKLGNSYFKSNNLEKAKLSFEKSLELKENNKTRKNLALTKKLLEQKEKKDKDKKENQKKSQKNDDKKNENKDSKSDKNKENNSKKSEQKENNKKESEKSKQDNESKEQNESKKNSNKESNSTKSENSKKDTNESNNNYKSNLEQYNQEYISKEEEQKWDKLLENGNKILMYPNKSGKGSYEKNLW